MFNFSLGKIKKNVFDVHPVSCVGLLSFVSGGSPWRSQRREDFPNEHSSTYTLRVTVSKRERDAHRCVFAESDVSKKLTAGCWRVIALA